MAQDRSSGDRLFRLLHPESIAVIGGGVAEEVIKHCDAMGYSGQIWPVHPKRTEMLGRGCFSSVADLPSAPDAAYIGINRHATIETVEALSRLGAGGAVCHASGFMESPGEGPELQEQLSRAAGSMPFIGPNCVGLINYLDGVPLWNDQHGGVMVEKGVAIVSQSGNLAINVSMNQRGLPIAYLFALGNQANVELSHAMAACLEDERVTAIGICVEGIRDVEAFDEVVRRAARAGKPVVALKAGASERGRALAKSHTASVAGSYEMFEAYCRRVGIAHVRSLAELIETLNLVTVVGPLKGNRIASLSASGGDAILMADGLVGRELEYPSLSDQHSSRVRDTLTELVFVSNPLDYHTFLWGDGPGLTKTFTAMLNGGFDLSLLVLDWPREDRCDAGLWEVAFESWVEAVRQTGAPAALLATLHEGLSESVSERFHSAGIATLRGMTEGLAAVEAAWRIGRAQTGVPPAALLRAADQPRDEEDSYLLDDAARKEMLSSQGISVSEGQEKGTDEVAVFALSVLRDPQFGPHVVIRSGGELAALVDDKEILLLPTNEGTIAEAIGRLRAARLLKGEAGKPVGDTEALVDVVTKLAGIVEAHKDQLLDASLNRLVVYPRGLGVVTADVMIRFKKG